jgi:hypothetical protein
MVETSLRLSRALAAACLLTACTRVIDPCPAGMQRLDEEDRCVDIDMVSAVDGGTDAMPDGALPDPEIDPDPDPATMDGSMEEPADAGRDSGPDGAVEDDAGLDGGADQCLAADSEAWKAFHIAPGIIANIVDCATQCANGACALDACLRELAGVDGCSECVAEEVACMAELCSSACGASSTDDACLACACEQGCTLEFASCAAASRGETCEDCDADVCEANMSMLPPELIMAVLQPVLFAPPVMMPVMP